MELETSKEKGKVQIKSACHGIRLYATTLKQKFWSTSVSMLRHHCLDATTLK